MEEGKVAGVATLEEISKAFIRWRNRKMRTTDPMPSELWDLVAEVIGAGLELDEISQVCSLNLKKLTRRVQGKDGNWEELGWRLDRTEDEKQRALGEEDPQIKKLRELVATMTWHLDPRYSRRLENDQYELFEKSREQVDEEILREIRERCIQMPKVEE